MVETDKEAAQCIEDNSTLTWAPIFSSEDGLKTNVQVRGGFNIVAGALPNCGARQQWPIYHYADSADRLVLMENGWLRHFVHARHRHDERHYDYEPRLFCMDRVHLPSGDEAQFAVVCNPETIDDETEARFIVLYILNPLFHAMSMTFLLATAIVYFIVPQLRDLLGNMVTTISLCLVIVYSADLVRLFRGFSEHVSFLAAGTNALRLFIYFYYYITF
jgi:G protein-coupled receptor Mth (Methuselah protein)